MAQIQIDIKRKLDHSQIMEGNLYTGERCVKIYIAEYEYENLMRDGFFIRDGKSRDSANVLNTTLVCHPAQEGQAS